MADTTHYSMLRKLTLGAQSAH